MKKYITLKDIAERTGVSVNSVSRALKGYSDISDETKARIKSIAQELGYVPHAAASQLRQGSNKSIGVIVTRIDNAFFSCILQGVNDCVANLGYTVLTVASNENIEEEKRAITLLTSYRVSGMLIVPAEDLKNTIDHAAIPAPHIEIVRPGRDKNGSFFISDSRRSGELAAGRFLSMGRKRPAYLGFSMRVSCNRERLRGYADTLKKKGVPLNAADIKTCDATTDAARETLSRWIQEGFEADALFVYNDAMAFGALRAFEDAGLKVPEDVSVIGHDDVEVAPSFIPRLTTVQVPKYRLGIESARALLDLIEPGREAPLPQRVIYQPELIVRET